MSDQIGEDGYYQGGLLCDGRGYRERDNIIFVSSYLDYCGLAQGKGNLIRVEYLKKISDPQWALPLWGDDISSSITNSIDDAKRLIEEYFKNKTDPSTSSG